MTFHDNPKRIRLVVLRRWGAHLTYSQALMLADDLRRDRPVVEKWEEYVEDWLMKKRLMAK